jgi:hypothetical protein
MTVLSKPMALADKVPCRLCIASTDGAAGALDPWCRHLGMVDGIFTHESVRHRQWCAGSGPAVRAPRDWVGLTRKEPVNASFCISGPAGTLKPPLSPPPTQATLAF